MTDAMTKTGSGKTKNFMFRVLCGFLLGTSVIAPGVSGSVIAVMMGIYPDLIRVISNPFKNFKKNFFYLLPMAIGGVLSLALGVLVLKELFEGYPIQARVLFIGLVAGGLPSMLRQAKSHRRPEEKNSRKVVYIIAAACAFSIAGGVGLLYRFGGGVTAAADFPLFFLCIAGAVSGICSMMPGMSVSMILMLFGVYEYLMKVASDFITVTLKSGINEATISLGITIAAVAGSFLIGMVLFSKLTKFVFDHFAAVAYFIVFGFMCGTLTAIFPKEPPATVPGWIISVVMLAAGLCISVLFIYLGKKFNVSEDDKAEEATAQES